MQKSALLNDSLVGKSFLTLKDFTKEEILYLIDLSAELKEMKKQRIPHRYLEGQNIALLFEKPSTRTRCAFTVACVDLGAHPEYLGKNDVQFGKKESTRDTLSIPGTPLNILPTLPTVFCNSLTAPPINLSKTKYTLVAPKRLITIAFPSSTMLSGI